MHIDRDISDVLRFMSRNLRVFFANTRLFITLVVVFSCLFQSLRDKQKSMRESQGPNMKQMKMWSVSLVLLLKTCQVRESVTRQNSVKL